MIFLVMNNQVLGKGIRRWITFLLYIVSLMYICSGKKKLFCAFIDYKKAFDSVQRGLLWGKLLNSCVNGKVLHVIRDMYVKAKSCVKTRHGLSQFFVSNVGLRQGENLSPVLFSLFFNDLKGFLRVTMSKA